MTDARSLEDRIADAADRCRAAQVAYFRSRALADLRASKAAESTLDRLLAERAAVAAGVVQTSLFDKQGH